MFLNKYYNFYNNTYYTKNEILSFKHYLRVIYNNLFFLNKNKELDYYYFNTKFKQNKRYMLTLVFNKLPIISFSYRKYINNSNSSINKKNRFISHSAILLYILGSISLKKKIILIYRNITFLNISLLKLFFKLSNKNKVLFYLISLKTSFSFKHSVYYKKISTIKKFRRKKYQSIFNSRYSSVYN